MNTPITPSAKKFMNATAGELVKKLTGTPARNAENRAKSGKKNGKKHTHGNQVPIFTRTIIGNDRTAYLREVNELKNFLKARKGDKSICIASGTNIGDNISAYLYVFDVPPKLVVRISNHDAKLENVGARTEEKVGGTTETIELGDKWKMFHAVLDITKKIK